MDKLSELKQMFNPQMAAIKTIQSMAPQIIPALKSAAERHFEKLDIEEKQENQFIGYFVARVNGKVMVAKCTGNTLDDKLILNPALLTMDIDQVAALLLKLNAEHGTNNPGNDNA